jgi:hypothetical protein
MATTSPIIPKPNGSAQQASEMEALQQLLAVNPAMDTPEIRELIKLRMENAKLKARLNQPLKFKVSEKQALSVYGMGRFPVTLYKEQWLRLLAASQDILDFIAEHEGEMAVKG